MTAAAFFSSTANRQSPPGVWNFKGSSWKCLRGSIKSKSDGLWTACECTGHSELIFLKIFFQLHETNWSWILQRGLVLHLWPWGVHFRSAESPRGTGDTSGGICVLFLLGKETLNGKMMIKWQFSSRSWALVHDYRMTARAMRRRPAMKQQQPWVVHLFENMVYVRYVAGLKSKNVPRELSNI